MTMLWLTVALMTGASVLIVLASLARSRPAVGGPADVAVYRDQIDEIARDRARGLIDESEAESARTEVARRLLAASERVEPDVADGGLRRRRIAAVAALIVIPAIALGTYGRLGTPDLPDMPLAARKSDKPDGDRLGDLVARVETELAKNPEDGRGWAVVAPIYLKLGRAGEAASAYWKAIRLLGSTPDREADLGEALLVGAGGVVTDEAREAFERSVAGDQPSVKGAFYLARAAKQDGDVAGAVARLKPLLAKAPEDAPYLDPLKEELQRLADVPALPRPTPEQADAVKTPEQRMAFIRTMVDGLAARLASDGGDLGDWLRLVNARAALGDMAEAREALGRARQRFATDVKATVRLEALALGLGLEGRGA